MDDSNVQPAANKNKMKLSIDFRIVSLVLLVVIAGLVMVWKPWDTPVTTDRVITVTGDAKMTAEPDEYVFYPTYEFKNADKTAALAELTAKSKEIIDKLKGLGVPDSKIKSNSSGYDFPVYYDVSDSREATYSLQLTVTISKLDLAQKVQDYLVTTSPTGSVSPQTSFSDSKQKDLESQARDKATKAARAKADQSAKNLGFKVRSVKSVDDGSGFSGGGGCGGFGLCAGANLDTMSVKASAPSLTVQPGENDLTYSVTVVYYIK